MDNEQEMLAKAMAHVETAVQDMAELGFTPQQRAIALAFHMNRQAEIAMPTEGTAALFKQSLIA